MHGLVEVEIEVEVAIFPIALVCYRNGIELKNLYWSHFLSFFLSLSLRQGCARWNWYHTEDMFSISVRKHCESKELNPSFI